MVNTRGGSFDIQDAREFLAATTRAALAPRIVRIGEKVYLVIGPDKHQLTIDDMARLDCEIDEAWRGVDWDREYGCNPAPQLMRAPPSVYGAE